MTVTLDPDRDVSLQGHYAGVVTRLVAFGIDVLVASAIFAICGRVVEYVLSAVLGRDDVAVSNAPVAGVIVMVLWALLYFAYPISAGGRTLGMAMVGLSVVARDGGGVSAGRAIVRTLCLPLSLAFVGIGLVMVLVNRERRSLHDLVAGTAVVYSWDARAARLRFLSREGTDPSA
jgi:uncharacterized RDD family membrane protein YckC